jgi:hypothetical protein
MVFPVVIFLPDLLKRRDAVSIRLLPPKHSFFGLFVELEFFKNRDYD